MTTEERLGTEIAGYRIESLIGRGGMGMVYLAEHVQLRRKVALKLLAPELAGDERFRERFIRESRIAASIEHPNIVSVYEAAEAKGQLFIAMRLVRGTDLKSLIKSEGRLEPDRVLPLLAQVASALDAAHAEGLVHRDVKPGNILVAPASDAESHEVAYLTDFGLTKRTSSDSGITATGQFVGTFDYAAPEQFEGGSLDSRTDVYSLTGVLYECLTAEVPFPRDQDVALMFAHMSSMVPKVTDTRKDLPKAVDEVIATGMAKSPSERFQSASELVRTARGVLGGEEVDLPEIRAWKKRRRRLRRRRRTRAILAAVLVMVMVAATATAIVLTRSTPRAAAAPAPATLVKIDPATQKVVGTPIRFGAGGGPVTVAAGSVWVADTRRDEIVRIDPNGGPRKRIPLGSDPTAIAAAEPEGALFVVTPNKFSRIGTDSNKPDTTRGLPSIPTSVAYGDGAVWVNTIRPVAGFPSGGILVRAHPTTLTFLSQITVPEAGRVAVGEGSVWILGSQLNRVNLKTKKTADPIEVPSIGQNIGLAAVDLAVANGAVWILDSNGTVFKVDPSSNKVTSKFTTGTKAIAMAVGEGAIWVLSRVERSVVRVDLATGAHARPIHVGANPLGIVVGDGSVWVTRGGG